MLEAIVEDVYNLLGVLDSPYFLHADCSWQTWNHGLPWLNRDLVLPNMEIRCLQLIFFLISTKSSGRSMCRSLMSWIQINVLYRLRYIVVPWTFVDIIFLGHINCHISFVENGSTNGYFVGFLSWTFHLWMDYATISTKIGAHEQNVI